MKKQAKQKKKKIYKPPKYYFGISNDKEFFTENLSALVESGMSITDSIGAIASDVRSSGMRKALIYVQKSVQNGSSLWKSLNETNLFREHVISLVRIGEETGRLAQNLQVVAVQEQKARIFNSKLKSAMLYPIFVMVLSVVVAVLLAWFILPRLALVFDQLNVTLPTITKMLIGLGVFLGDHGSIVVPAFGLVVGLIVYFLFFFSKTKILGQSILFHIPGVGRLMKQLEMARFGFLLGTLLEAGIPITDALNSLEHSTKFFVYQRIYRHIREKVSEGHTIQDALSTSKKSKHYIASPIQQMIFSAELSGSLPETLKKIGNLYETKTETTTKDLTVILEPVLLVIVWLGVVGVAMAVILPIYSLIGGFNQP